MAQRVADVMTGNPATIEAGGRIADAAALMRNNDTGAVIVTDNGRVSGIVTDRDIAVRAVADEKGPDTPVRDVCSGGDVATVGPDTSIDQAARLMRQKAVRRLPVVEKDRAVGVVSIGDLAMEKDPNSALADISSAEGNR
ncbi:CBS domain-containing protein [Bailinhaonella thermotolerans]|uniref:CBS domain-containing protein n=1 Tax=Bailinhaonella thermotolerans TaxID=1070861 RepID=A0A3A4AN07_9ACTN|nr:CBS domain-containing protein [Bailinhaonella thermotolerans]RJL22728.1 CBS domain-containing protein [Bailinhaonella thermotolerans]